jgi:IS30 family transposase
MLTQEEYLDGLKLRHEGFTITEIAEELGYHPATVAKWMLISNSVPVIEQVT